MLVRKRFLIFFFFKYVGKGRNEISRKLASKLTWAPRGSERSVLRILCCVSGEEAGADDKGTSAPFGILRKIIYPSRPWRPTLSPCYYYYHHYLLYAGYLYIYS
jgi:hypothetical protein